MKQIEYIKGFDELKNTLNEIKGLDRPLTLEEFDAYFSSLETAIGEIVRVLNDLNALMARVEDKDKYVQEMKEAIDGIFAELEDAVNASYNQISDTLNNIDQQIKDLEDRVNDSEDSSDDNSSDDSSDSSDSDTDSSSS